MDLSAEQREKMRHALGLDRQKVAYRNHYITLSSDPDWEDLVERKLARDHHINDGRDNHNYSVTALGFSAVAEPGETDDGEIGIQDPMAHSEGVPTIAEMALRRARKGVATRNFELIGMVVQTLAEREVLRERAHAAAPADQPSTTIVLPPREGEWLRKAAEQAGQTKDWIVTQALRAYSADGQPASEPVGIDKFD